MAGLFLYMDFFKKVKGHPIGGLLLLSNIVKILLLFAFSRLVDIAFGNFSEHIISISFFLQSGIQ
jgi:hypothetical protein